MEQHGKNFMMAALLRILSGLIAAILSTSCALALYHMAPSWGSYSNPLGTFTTILEFVSMLSILPAAAVVAIGEYLPIRHAAYYSCAGVAAGLIGWFFVRDVIDASHLYVIVPTGAFAGFVYWLAAGRCAGRARGSR